MTSGPPTHDPTLQNQLNSSNPNPVGQVQINSNGTGEVNLAQSSQFNGLDQSQIMTLLRALPNMGGFAKVRARVDYCSHYLPCSLSLRTAYHDSAQSRIIGLHTIT